MKKHNCLKTRAQPGEGLKGLKFSQVKVKKNDKISYSFDFFVFQ